MKEQITKEGLLKAYYGAFDKPVNFDHKPTIDDFLDIRLRAVADYVREKVLKEVEMKK